MPAVCGGLIDRCRFGILNGLADRPEFFVCNRRFQPKPAEYVFVIQIEIHLRSREGNAVYLVIYGDSRTGTVFHAAHPLLSGQFYTVLVHMNAGGQTDRRIHTDDIRRLSGIQLHLN